MQLVQKIRDEDFDLLQQGLQLDMLKVKNKKQDQKDRDGDQNPKYKHF